MIAVTKRLSEIRNCLTVLFAAAGILLLVWATTSTSFAQGLPRQEITKAPLSRRATDSLRVNDQLYAGLVYHQGPNTVSIVVEREWLKTIRPDSFPQLSARETERYQQTVAKYEQRFDDWIKEYDNEEAFAKALEIEKERFLENHPKEVDPKIGLTKKLMAFTFPRSEITGLRIQNLRKRRALALAWKHEIQNSSLRSFSDLNKALKAKDVDVDQAFFDLTRDMTPAELSEQQWNIRKAMFEFENRDPLEFQGQGDQLLEVGAEVNLNQVIASMMGNAQNNSIQQLGRELGLPEFANVPKADNKRWIKQVTSKADAQSKKGVLVKRLLDSTNRDVVVVEAAFLAKVDQQRWKLVTQVRSEARLSAQTEEQLNLVRGDVRVKQTIAMMQQLGLGNQNSLLDEAMRKGAATNQAIQNVSEKFDTILGQNTNRIEAPWMLD